MSPPRKVYSITASGHALFHQLERDYLASVGTAASGSDVALMLINYLDRPEAVIALRKRLDRLNALLEEQAAVPSHGGLLSIDLTLAHVLAVRRADRDWLAGTSSVWNARFPKT